MSLLHTGRRLLRVDGSDAFSLLQALITADLRQFDSNKTAVYTFFLNNRGRVVQDSIIYSDKVNDHDHDHQYLVECDGDRLVQLKAWMEMYRFRKKVDLSVDQRLVLADPTSSSNDCIPDPRHPLFGARFLTSNVPERVGEEKDYRLLRYKWGLAEGWAETGDQLPTMLNGDLMGALSDGKGCYIGQELVARAVHGGVTRRRTLPFVAEESVDCSPVLEGSIQVGKVIACEGVTGLAQLPPAFVGKKLTCRGVPLIPHLPQWWPAKLNDQ